MKVKKKPIVVDAWEIITSQQAGELAQAVIDGLIKYCEDGSVLVNTLEGVMQGSPGDWIIRGINGEYYPCKRDIFLKTYDAVYGSL